VNENLVARIPNFPGAFNKGRLDRQKLKRELTNFHETATYISFSEALLESEEGALDLLN
jgi:hypothetical protein